MQFFEAIQQVEQSDEFSVPEDAYLAHVFKMFDDANVAEWQVGYYDPAEDEVIVFTVSPSGIRKNPPAEAFKRDERAIAPLDPSKLATAPKEAVSQAKELLAEKHPGHPPKQVILLAQTLDEFGQVYNITVVTETFHMYNVKLSTDSGAVVDERFDHLMSLKKE